MSQKDLPCVIIFKRKVTYLCNGETALYAIKATGTFCKVQKTPVALKKKKTSHKPSRKKEKVLHYSFSSSFLHEILKRTNTVIILPATNFPYFMLSHWTGPSNVLFVGEFWHWMPKCLCVCIEHFYTLFCTSLSNIGHTSSPK